MPKGPGPPDDHLQITSIRPALTSLPGVLGSKIIQPVPLANLPLAKKGGASMRFAYHPVLLSSVPLFCHVLISELGCADYYCCMFHTL